MKTTNNYLNIFLITCCLVLLMMGCGDTNKNSNSDTDTATSKPKTTSTTVEPPAKNATVNGTRKTAIFKDAKTYSGASYYFFTDSLGKTINIRVSSFESDDRLQMPANLLLPKTKDDIPAKVNPAMVGKSFTLTYNDRGKVVAVVEN